MALAGDMKLKNFLALAGGVGFLGLAGLCGGTWWLGDQATDAIEQKREARPVPEIQPVVAAPEPGVAPAPAAGAPAAPAPATPPGQDPLPAGLSPMEQAVWKYQGKNLGSDKLKDVSKGKPYKINVYQDAPNPTANRAKVDLDRDDKWDEKWTFKAGAVQRQIAPADDEQYTQTLMWDGSAWVPES